jgi:hypothetical protein
MTLLKIVSITTRLQTGQSRFRIAVAARDFFSSPECPDWLWGPPSFLFSAYWGSFLGVQWLGHEIYHSPVSGAEVKNEWSCTSAPLCPHDMDSEICIFFLLCVDAVIVFLLLLAFFELYAD